MTATVEDRLARAGEQLDRLIEAEPLPARPEVSPARDVIRRPLRWTIAALAAVACVLAAVVWTQARSTHRTTTVPATDVSVSATTDTAASTVPAATPTTPAPAPGATATAPLAIGTSVMLGAADALAAGGFWVVADVSLQAADQIDTLRHLTAAGEVGDVVVVETGVNGPVPAEQYDEIAQLLADVPTVVLLTVHADVPWAEPNNDLVWSLARTFPNVTVLDWAGLVDFGNIPGIASDGIHLGTGAARQAYANFVFDAIGRPELAQPLDGYRAMGELSGVLPSIVPLPDGSDPNDLPRLTAPGLGAAVTGQGARVCVTSNDDGWSGGGCSNGGPTGLVDLLVGSEVPEPVSKLFLVHRADVGVVGDEHCVIASSVAAGGLVLSGCDMGTFPGVVHLTFTLPDGTSILTSTYDSGVTTGLPGLNGMTASSLVQLGHRLPPMAPVDGSWAAVRFLDGTVQVHTGTGRPCVEFQVGDTSIGGCPPDGQRTGLVSVVDRAAISDSNTVVLLHDASVTVTAVEGCTIERIDVADAGLAISGCTADASSPRVVLDVAHDGRVDRVVVPFTA